MKPKRASLDVWTCAAVATLGLLLASVVAAVMGAGLLANLLVIPMCVAAGVMLATARAKLS